MEPKSHHRRAVVVGGSISGLLAARVLSDFYDEVIVLERDELSHRGHRRGVPHGRHAHALLAGGLEIVEDLFPGISDELTAAGAVPADPLKDGTWFFEGAPLRQAPSKSAGVMSSRPFLESIVRRRVRRLDRVEIRDGQSVKELLSSDGRITGVVTDSGPMGADMIIDATGRGSQAANWLRSLGYRAARQEKVEVQLAYCTRVFQPGNNRIGSGDKFAVVAPTPDGKRGGVIALQEGGTWIVTLFGHFGHAAPIDLKGFTEFAKSLPSRIIYDAIRSAEPVGEAAQFRFPASTRRHYENLRQFPERFLVFGDAICSFNPIYGQGMSVAALQAQALYETLNVDRVGGWNRFFKKAAALIDNPWKMSVGSDLKMPETIGRRSLGTRLINNYIADVQRHAHTDAATAVAFTRVAQLLESPSTLMKPGLAARVLIGKLRRRFGAARDFNRAMLTTVEPKHPARGDGF